MVGITSRTIAIASVLVFAPAAGARADAVAYWSRIALNSILEESRQSSPDALNTLASVHVAMFETLNFIEARYTPRYVVEAPSPMAMLGEPAAAAAAHYVLAQAYPDRRIMLDQELHASLVPIDRDPAASTTKVVGRSLAAIVWAVRTRTPAASTQGLGAIDPQAWRRVVDLVASKSFRPIERARIYALVSIAADEAMAAALTTERSEPPARVARLCAACAVQAAVDTVLRVELGSVGFAHPLPSLIFPDAQSVAQINFLSGPDDSVAASRELGAQIGRRVSRTFYRPRSE